MFPNIPFEATQEVEEQVRPTRRTSMQHAKTCRPANLGVATIRNPVPALNMKKWNTATENGASFSPRGVGADTATAAGTDAESDEAHRVAELADAQCVGRAEVAEVPAMRCKCDA